MADFTKIIEALEKLTVVEMADLVKQLEEKFGVSAAAVAVAAPGAAAGAPAAEEQTEFKVCLKEVGANKINVIKAVREITGLGLAEAKGLVDNAPSVLKEGVEKKLADEFMAKLKEAGATGELK